MTEPKTLREAIQYFNDPENCRKFMVFVRWPDGIVRCPHCGNTGVSYMEKAKVYFCPNKHPKQKFSLKVGTIFEESAIGLEKWLPSAWLIANCKNGISSYELARAIGLTQKSAWFVLHRLREAMQQDMSFKLGSEEKGTESDEAHIGGAPKNKHLKVRAARMHHMRNGNKTVRSDKTPVVGLLDREARKVRAYVIPDVSRETLQNVILNHVDKKSPVYTDSSTSYAKLESLGFVHEAVNHVVEYVRGEVHTNGLENFWSLLKRSLRGTYVAVEPFHLDGYVTEQVWRYNARATKDNPLTDADRFVMLMTQVSGKRLTYAKLTGKEEESTAL